MTTDENRYVLLDIEKLSDLEKDIILALGDDINNRSLPQRDNVKELKRTKELLKDRNDDEFFQALSLLYLKGIVDFNNDARKNKENDPNPWMSNFTERNFIGFLQLILYRLEQNYKILKNPEANAYFDRDFESNAEKNKELVTKIEAVESKLNVITCSNKSKKELDEFIKYFDNAKTVLNSDVVAPDIMNYKATIGIAELWLQVYTDRNDITKILKTVVAIFFDDILVEYTYLTSYQVGINGIQIYNYILDKRLGENFKRLDKLEEDYNEINNRTNKNLIANIEVISIFVAVITLVIGNVSFLPQISENSLLGAVSLILIINGSLITGISTFVLVLAHVFNIESKNQGAKLKWKKVLICVCAGLLVVGIGLSVVDTFCGRNEEVYQPTEEAISNDTILVIPQKIESNSSADVSNSVDSVEEESEDTDAE